MPTTLTIPDNIPADVMRGVQSFLDSCAKADAEGGGIDTYILIVVSEDGEVKLCGVAEEPLMNAVGQVVTTIGGMMANRDGETCACPKCRPGGRPDAAHIDPLGDFLDKHRPRK